MDAAALGAWLDARAAAHEFSGVAMAWAGGEPLFAHAAGLAERRHRVPLRVDSRFLVASITKMTTAAAALRLVERGVLSLDRPLVDLLPPEHQPVAMTAGHTLHHVLSHTSGIPNYHDPDDPTFDSFTAAWDRVPPHRARRPADLLPLFADRPAVFAPGERFQYGDVNYVMAGLVIEAVTGRRFDEVIADEVLGPAGMADSGFSDLDLDPPGLATGYVTSDGPPETWPSHSHRVPVGGMPDGGLITTAAELCRLVDAFNDGRLVSEETIAAMRTEYGRINDDAESYGYGTEMLIEDGRVTIWGHAGGDPGVSAMLSHFVDDGVTIAVTCNIDRGSWSVSKWLAGEIGVRDPRV